MSKTTLAGILGAFLMLTGPWAGGRLQGDTTQPPITGGQLLNALLYAALGKLAEDQKKASEVANTSKDVHIPNEPPK